MHETFPRGIEVVCGIVIRNQAGQILLMRSHNWRDKWVLPGGHIEPGETIFEGAVREGKEETGLDLRPVVTYNSGELIHTSDYKRPAHFVYFNVVLGVTGGEENMNREEHYDYQWVNPQEALQLDLAESFDLSIKKYLEWLEHA